MWWSIPRIWESGDVWIIGGGPSVPKQFGIPDKIIQDVVAGNLTPDAYSPYMKALHDKHVIGVNIAFMIGSWVDMVFFGDISFFRNQERRLAAFPGLKVSCNPGTERFPWVKTLGRDGQNSTGISGKPDKVSWNGNSGAAAVSVAVHAGAKRVILLGFDMSLNEQGQQHWHDVYGRRFRPKNKPLRLPFSAHLRGFNKMEMDAKRLGVEIINANPGSAIPNFRKVNVRDILK